MVPSRPGSPGMVAHIDGCGAAPPSVGAVGSTAPADGEMFLGGDSTTGEATACKSLHVMECFPSLSQWESGLHWPYWGRGCFVPTSPLPQLLPAQSWVRCEHTRPIPSRRLRGLGSRTPLPGALPGTGFHPAWLGGVMQTSVRVAMGPSASPGSGRTPLGAPHRQAQGCGPHLGLWFLIFWCLEVWVGPQRVQMTPSLWDRGHCPSSSCPGSYIHPFRPPSSSSCLAPGRLRQVWVCPQTSCRPLHPQGLPSRPPPSPVALTRAS